MILTDPYRYVFSGPFTPLILPNLRGWWDASDNATVTESGGLVSQWDDKSGNANHAVQSTGANKFSLISAAQNGLDVMRATGLGNMALTTGAVLSSGAFYIFLVAGNSDTANGTLFLNAAGSTPYAMHLTGGGELDAYGGRTVSGLGSAAEDGSIHLMSHVVTGSGWTTKFDAASASAAGAGFGGLTVAGICQYVTSSLWLDGSVCEIIIGSAALSPSLVLACETYLQTKWGTP